jgi:hypothetical protein
MTNTSFILNLKFFRLALNFSTKKAPNHRAFLDYKALRGKVQEIYAVPQSSFSIVDFGKKQHFHFILRQ